ncbi:MAG: YggN family protein [Colwellia sp.]
MKKFHYHLLNLYLLSFLLLSFSSVAEKCSVNFNYGVIIDPTHIRMVEKGLTRVQINNRSQLFIDGRELTLTSHQQNLLSEYAANIRQQIPSIVSIAIDGVDIGLKAVNKVIGSLTGENSASQQKIQTKFEDLKLHIRSRFNQSDNNYYIAPQDFDDFDEIFTGEFEQAIEEIISDSIGTILLAVGEAILAENDNNNEGEQRTITFDERMANMGKDLEIEISASAKALEKKAEKFCLKLVELDKLENTLQQTITPLQNYDLIKASLF